MSEIGYKPAPAGDFVLPFDLPAAGARGRLVRLTDASARALGSHALPEAAARIAGELLALVTMLGSLVKLDGRLTAQTGADGPLDLAVADYYGADESGRRGVRGYARIDAAKFSALGPNPPFAAIVGKGALAITVRPRIEDKSYQGVVKLLPEGLAASAESYFSQSEQLSTKVRLAAATLFTPGVEAPAWRAGGLLIQSVPGGKAHDPDDWNRLSLLAATTEDVELVDADLAAETLLWRLFHQDEVRLLPAEPVIFRCDCSTGVVAAVLRNRSPEERAALADADGIIRAKCEFCGMVHAIAADGGG